jgi:hypothetical protein
MVLFLVIYQVLLNQLPSIYDDGSGFQNYRMGAVVENNTVFYLKKFPKLLINLKIIKIIIRVKYPRGT